MTNALDRALPLTLVFNGRALPLTRVRVQADRARGRHG